ncbi:hypothetical protein B9Z55_020177 [Caenorhabditis nigoni]|uniref:Uncharacterized protein n=1 Tax=Caenorhabditis nigoni TaxID=1611254 RepID=A0A2G5TLQ0_9PELO|nr:hypothetical protein B9Z55_020177 [Caenorhabditis nigoni]
MDDWRADGLGCGNEISNGNKKSAKSKSNEVNQCAGKILGGFDQLPMTGTMPRSMWRAQNVGDNLDWSGSGLDRKLMRTTGIRIARVRTTTKMVIGHQLVTG